MCFTELKFRIEIVCQRMLESFGKKSLTVQKDELAYLEFAKPDKRWGCLWILSENDMKIGSVKGARYNALFSKHYFRTTVPFEDSGCSLIEYKQTAIYYTRARCMYRYGDANI